MLHDMLLRREGDDKFDLILRHQLVPELAETISGYGAVIFVDAKEGPLRGQISVTPIEAGVLEHTALFHRFEPQHLLHLCRQLYDHTPIACALTLQSDDFDIKENLSCEAQLALEIAVPQLHALVNHYLNGEFSALQVRGDYNSPLPDGSKIKDANLDRAEIYEFVCGARDKVIQKLQETNTPPYPRYYEKIFKEIVLTIENDELIKLYKRYSQEEGKSSEDEELQKYIKLAQESIEHYSVTNKSITKVARAQNDYLESVNLEDIGENRINYEKIVSSLIVFQNQLLEELKKSDDKVRKLEAELQSALSESKIDPLTKALNKRAFNSDLQSILEAGFGKELNMAILRITPDGFSRINELYGHMAGDKILIFLANTFRSSLRDGDKIYRYDEDEFIIFLNRLSGEKALEIATRIKTKVEASKLVYSEEIIKATVSIGLTMHLPNDTLESMMHKAGSALAQARAKQNTVVEHN